MKRVGLVFGGRSVEHEVSIDSARSVAVALDEAGFDCVPIGVTGEGRWLGPELSDRILRSDRPRAEPESGDDAGVSVLPDPGGGRLAVIDAAGSRRYLDLDVVFPLVHGWGGEDGRLQGALDLVGFPTVGSGVAGSALAMDKILARKILDGEGIPSVAWVGLTRRDGNGESSVERIAARLECPLFVKPANGGSSVGISRVETAADLPAALDRAFECDRRVIVEKGIDAREIECAVLGNGSPRASVLGEVVPSREFYDYESKYVDGTSELIIPADLESEQAQAIRRIAIEAYEVLDLAGFARVDFLVDRATGRHYLNEVNTLPGFTVISMFPRLWEASGVPYSQLVAELVSLAEERWRSEGARRVRWRPS